MSATEQADDQTSEPNGDPQESTEQTMQTRLRDLRPEKDPMGAGQSMPDHSTAR